MNSHPASDSEDGGSFPRSAAKFATTTAPAILIPLGAVLKLAGDGTTARLLSLIIGLIGMLLVGAGFVCALIALCNVRRFGREGLLRRGIVGLIFHGVFLAIIGVSVVQGFVRGLAQAVHARESQRDVRPVEDDRSQRPHSEQGATNGEAAKTRALRASLEKAAADSRGDTAKILKVVAAYIEQLEVASKNLKGAHSVMQVGKVLQFTNAFDADDFARRRRVVLNYQAATERIRALLTNAPAFYRTELQQLGMSPPDIDNAVACMQKQSAGQSQLLYAARETDARKAAATLQIFDLLESYPDQWRWKSGELVFSQPHHARDYNRLIYEIQTAASDQREAQRKIVTSQ
jgi:hypothetical protein